MRRTDAAAALVVLAGLAGAVLWLRAEGERLEGAVRVVDGDTLDLEGRRIRLTGLDAPELAQRCARPSGEEYPCGETARSALRQAVAGRPVVCVVSGRDRYGRALARCLAGGDDVGAAMVRGGHAVAAGAYRAEEAEARRERAGLWDGSFEPPSAWRDAHRRRPGDA